MIPEKIAEKIAEKINSDLVHENLSLRRQLAEAQAENAKLLRLLAGAQQLIKFYGSIRNYPLSPVPDGAKWPGCLHEEGEVKL